MRTALTGRAREGASVKPGAEPRQARSGRTDAGARRSRQGSPQPSAAPVRGIGPGGGLSPRTAPTQCGPVTGVWRTLRDRALR